MNIMLINFFDVVNSAGGMERVLCNMANELIARGHKVTIVCCDRNVGCPFYYLDKQVNFINLNGTGKNFKVSFLLKFQKELLRFCGKLDVDGKEKYRLKFLYNNIFTKLKKTIKFLAPDIIISYDKDSLMLLKNIFNIKTPVVAMMHSDANIFLNERASKFLITAYDKANCVQVLIKNNIEVLNKYCPNSNITWIPNAVKINERKSIDKTFYKIVTVGRLEKKAKQQHLLIESFKKIANEIPPEWNVEIIGGTNNTDEESYKKYMQNYVEREFLTSKISFTGPVKNVNEYLLKADIFAFPSAYEGFGLALTEAMSAGLPAIGYKSCPSVNELIIDGYNGFLCDDGIDDFAEKLKILMSDAELRKKMGQNARESMKQFAPEKIWDQWEALINEVIAEHKKVGY